MSRTKYTLIEREGYHPTAVSKEVLADMLADQHADKILSQRPVTQAEIKRDRIHILDDQYHFESKAWEQLRRKLDGKPFQARVAWFDNLRGIGCVDGLNGEGHHYIYACNIPGAKTWFAETACVSYEKNQIVNVRVDFQGLRTAFTIGITPGTLDVEGWNNIKGKNLAFRTDEMGNAVTGLFA